MVNSQAAGENCKFSPLNLRSLIQLKSFAPRLFFISFIIFSTALSNLTIIPPKSTGVFLLPWYYLVITSLLPDFFSNLYIIFMQLAYADLRFLIPSFITRLPGTWHTLFNPLSSNPLTCTNPVPHSFIPSFFNSFITMVHPWYTLIVYI